MRRILVPRQYQDHLHDFGRGLRRANWWAGPGSGKTGTGLMLFNSLRFFGEVKHLLVVSTKRIANYVWTNEADKWEQFANLDIAVAIGTPDQRLAALRQGASITTINYDNLGWLAETLGDHWPFDMVIADEATKLKSLKISLQFHHKTGTPFLRSGGGSKRAAAFAKAAHHKVRYWINMTGTPAPNGLLDLWGQMWFIDGGARLGRSTTAYRDRWFHIDKPKDNPHEVKYVPHYHSEAEIKALVREVTMTVDARDYMELPDTVFNRIIVPLPEKARSLYREMEREMHIELEGKDIDAVNGGAKTMKCRQLASGAVYALPDQIGDAAPWLWVHDEKMDALEDLVEELNGAPLLIAYQFRSDLERLRKAFPQGRYFDENPETLAAFRRGEIPQLFIHPASGGHGIDGMQDACNQIAFFSQTWNLEEYEQVIERIGNVRQVSSGQFRNTFVHLICAKNTIDIRMVDRLEQKAVDQQSLSAGMKRLGVSPDTTFNFALA